MLTRDSSTPKPEDKTSLKALARLRSSVVPFVAGALAAVPLTVVAVLPGLSKTTVHTVFAKAADEVTSCSQPASTGGSGGGEGGGAVLGASTSLPTGGGSGGGEPAVGGAGGGETTPLVQALVGGNLTATGSITGPTGPNSNNTVTSNQTQTTTVTNTNTISVTNTNNQSASTGSAEVEGNTTGGSAVSGDASNQNSTNLDVHITN